MATRYLVSDLAANLPFYVDLLGYEVEEQWGPAFAILVRNGERLWLSGPQTSAAQPMPDGRKPEPGGWNRIVLVVENFDDLTSRLRAFGVTFQNDPLSGPGGRQVLIEDPSGNPIELFEARA